MPRARVNGQNLYYQLHASDPEASQLLLIHGAGGSRLSWPNELRALPKTTVLSLDLPGHGRSEAPSRISIEGYADDVLRLIRILDLDNVSICGHSMGGAIAMQIALCQPPELAGLILLGTGARLRVTDQILGQIRQNFPEAVNTIMRFSWSKETTDELIDADRAIKAQTGPEVVLGDYIACNDFDVMRQIHEITVPALIISGTADQLTPEKYGRFLADRISHSRFVTIEEGAHMMAQEKPRLVAQAVSEFLSRLQSAKHR